MQKVKNMAQAIDLDNQIERLVIPNSALTELRNDPTVTDVSYDGKYFSFLPDQLRAIAGYKSGITVMHIDERIVGLASDKFAPIPLEQAYDTMVEKLGQPVREKPFGQGIMVMFSKLKDIGDFDRRYANDLHPATMFGFNLGNSSFKFGFVQGFPFCQNQLHLLGGQATKNLGGRIMHLRGVVSKFDLSKSITSWLNGAKDLELLMRKAIATKVNEAQELIVYSKASQNQSQFLEFSRRPHSMDLLDQQVPENLMDVVNNVTRAFSPEHKAKFLTRKNEQPIFDSSVSAGDILVTCPVESFKLSDYISSAKDVSLLTDETREEFKLSSAPFWDTLSTLAAQEAEIVRR